MTWLHYMERQKSLVVLIQKPAPILLSYVIMNISGSPMGTSLPQIKTLWSHILESDLPLYLPNIHDPQPV